MTLYTQWQNLVESHQGHQELNTFWQKYFDMEKNNYQRILTEKRQMIEGTVAQLAPEFDMDEVTFCGFLYGINESIDPPMEMDAIESETPLSFTIDWEKLYYNMHAAKADWLYNLPQWPDILSDEKRKEIAKAYRISGTDIAEPKIGRNEPCPCGSGLKYKKCCGKAV